MAQMEVPILQRLQRQLSDKETAKMSWNSPPKFDIHGSYKLKPAFSKALKTLPGGIFDPRKEVYKYSEVTNMMTAYILGKRNELLFMYFTELRLLD